MNPSEPLKSLIFIPQIIHNYLLKGIELWQLKERCIRTLKYNRQ